MAERTPLDESGGMMYVQVQARTNPHRMDAEFWVPGAIPQRIFIEASVPLSGDAEAWLVAALPLAMASGLGLSVSGALECEIISSLDQAQDLLRGWYPHLQKVSITRDSAKSTAGHGSRRGIGCFFSGGVDSFFSAITHSDSITHLIFVHGFDIPLADQDLATASLSEARSAAVQLGTPLIEVSTNIRELSEGTLRWGHEYHGAAMAFVGHALSSIIRHAIIPGSHSTTEMPPWGTHPHLDPLWGSSQLSFVHDSVGISRTSKIHILAQHQVALDHLRVCWENRGGRFNCGRCEKCVRTMIGLESAGALRMCRTLPGRLGARQIAQLRIDSLDAEVFAAQNLAFLRAMPGSSRVRLHEAALIWAIRKGKLRRAVKGAVRQSPSSVDVPLAHSNKPTIRGE